MHLRVVLVEPLYEGNVGSAARAMKNFGFSDLVLVRPCKIGDFGLAMASHARDLIEDARIASSIEEAVDGASLVVGTTGKRLQAGEKHLRLHIRAPYLTPSDLRRMIEGMDGIVAILLGREDWGLTNDELALCDTLVSIPTSPQYPVMNLSMAAAVILYELSKASHGGSSVKMPSRETIDLLNRVFLEFLRAIMYPPHKIEYIAIMFKRIIGRSALTEREAHTMLSIFKRAMWRIGRGGEK
jgi:TrmH family RNA methyltransferase